MGYGQHQSFYIRELWLTKGMKALKENPYFFTEKESFEKIGLGKNMLQSLKYWIQATGIAVEKSDSDRKKYHELTELGQYIYEKDKYVRYNETIALLHYNLCSKQQPATAWYWFFNQFKLDVFDKHTLGEHLFKWVKENEEREISEKSLKRDIDCLVSFFTVQGDVKDPESVTSSLFAPLGLIQIAGDTYMKQSVQLDLMDEIYKYILLDYAFNIKKELEISVDEIEFQTGLLGNLFLLKRTEIISFLTRWSRESKNNITYVRTNNLDFIRLPKIEQDEMLKIIYNKKEA